MPTLKNMFGNLLGSTAKNKPIRDRIKSKNTPLSLYNNITRDFVHPGKSDYELVGDTLTRHTREGEIFSAKYDEPTYLTFRIHFHIDDDTDDIVDNTNGYKKYDTLPHPFLKSKKSPTANISYSTVDYLRNNLGEAVRADLLERFIKELNDIQTYYPYYFTQINGINNYLKIDSSAGRRVKSDSKAITIKCNEALDMRITQLISIYRKIAWDDVYQRWILPDMMRFFKMDIYISELRVFHRVKSAGTAQTTISTVSTTADIPSKSFALISDALNEVIPTIKLELEQCEFDISDSMAHLDSFISSKHNEAATPSLKILVGNIKETHVYGLNKDMEDIIRRANNSNGIPETILHNDILSDDILQNYYFFDDDNTESALDTYYNLFKGLSSPSSTKSRGFGNGLYEDEYTPMDTTTIQQMGVLGNFLKGGINMTADEAKRWTTIGINKGLDYLQRGGLSSENGDTSGQNTINTSLYGDKLNGGQKALLANDILMDIANGDVGALLKYTRDAIEKSTAAKDLNSRAPKSPEEKRVDSTKEALKSTLETIYANATDKSLPLVQEVEFMLKSGMSAADMDRHIKSLYKSGEFGTSNEVIDDKNKGYSDPGLIQEEYESTANNTSYKNQNIMNSPYVSSANENGAVPANIQVAPLNSTANGNSAIPANIQIAPLDSKANKGNVVDKFNPKDRGTSNEAIDDFDNGYRDPGITQSPYTSTVNSLPTVNPGLINPKYLSLANKNSAVPANIQIAPLDSTANKNSAVPANIQVSPLDSTANRNSAVPANIQVSPLDSTANKNSAVPANIQIAPLNSTANKNGAVPANIQIAPLDSKANGNSVTDNINPNYRGTSNEAIDDLDNGYRNPGLINPKYVSTATTSKKNE